MVELIVSEPSMILFLLFDVTDFVCTVLQWPWHCRPTWFFQVLK